jgi:hypothetical protein
MIHLACEILIKLDFVIFYITINLTIIGMVNSAKRIKT